MKFSRDLINFDESITPELSEQKAKTDEFNKKYEKICNDRETVGSNGIKHRYIDVGHEIKELIPHTKDGKFTKGKILDAASDIKDAYVKDAKSTYHGFKDEVADKVDSNGNVLSWKKKPMTLLRTEEDELNSKLAKSKGEKSPGNNAIFGTLGFKSLETAAPFAIGAAFLGSKLYKRRKRKKLYKDLIDEGYSPSEAKKLSEQVNNSEQTNFNALTGVANTTKSGFKWILENGIIAPFKGRKVVTSYNPVTGKIEKFKDGIRATKDILGKDGNVVIKKGDFIREGGVTGAETLPGKIGAGALGAMNVGLTASLLTMPAAVASDFKRDYEYKKKYIIDPNKHYVIEQDLVDNRKVRLIGKVDGYINRTDANIEADRHSGNGMYQVYAIKGSELARTIPKRFSLEYNNYEY